MPLDDVKEARKTIGEEKKEEGHAEYCEVKHTSTRQYEHLADESVDDLRASFARETPLRPRVLRGSELTLRSVDFAMLC